MTTASMGPLVYTSGNHEWGVTGECGRHKLQWGRWFTPAETFRATSERVVACWGFNGAAGLHQRKPEDPAGCRLAWPQASMGPLVYTSGNRKTCRSPKAPILSLQWGRWFTPAETRAGGVQIHT